MKILLLVITTTWSFGIPSNGPRTYVVDSREQAAQLVSDNDRSRRGQVEPDQFAYDLYEVDLSKKSVVKIKIPVMKVVYDTTDAPDSGK